MAQSTSLVLFDIDGTLMRGAGHHHKLALIEGVRRIAQLPVTLDGIPTSGMLDRDLIAMMLRASGFSERRTRVILRKAMAECQDAYLSDCAADLTPFLCAGVVNVLAELQRRGAALGLVTGNLSRIGWRKLELAGLRSYFPIGAFAEDGRTRTRIAKVASWRAIRGGLVTKNCRISLIGDHENDIRAAKANGFQSIAVATGVTSLEELKAWKPGVLVRDLTELDLETVL